MTKSLVAKFVLGEKEALHLANAFDDDERLAALPVSVGQANHAQWQVLVYLTEDARAEVAALRQVSRSLFGSQAPRLSMETLPDVDWVAKSLDGLPPVRVGRFLVHGSHGRKAPRANDIAIEVEANQAFGTGHHGTTAGCLMAIDRLSRTRPIACALDIGTGSGVLAIAIAKATKASVLASDIDPLAVAIARENVRLNHVLNCVTVVLADGVDKREFHREAPYDLVVANILAEPLVALAPKISRCLAPGGTLILSGLLPNQRARVVSAYRGQGLPLLRPQIHSGWLTLAFRCPTRRER